MDDSIQHSRTADIDDCPDEFASGVGPLARSTLPSSVARTTTAKDRCAKSDGVAAGLWRGTDAGPMVSVFRAGIVFGVA